MKKLNKNQTSTINAGGPIFQ